MSVRNSLLAVLTLGHCYGFQLKSEFERRTGGLWPVNVGQVYTTLDRLVRDKLVAKGDATAEGRAYFEITEAGRAEVARWLGSPVDPAAGVRDELAIKYVVATTLPGQDARAVLGIQRDWVDGRRAELQSTLDSLEGDAVETRIRAIGVEAQHARLDAEKAWISVQLARPLIEPFPLEEGMPRRGRPARLRVEE